MRKVCCFLHIIYQVLELIFAAIQDMMLVRIEVLHLHVNFKFNLHLDIVIWDSHPLALGATPRQIYIDGAHQLENPQELNTFQIPNSLINTKLGHRNRRNSQMGWNSTTNRKTWRDRKENHPNNRSKKCLALRFRWTHRTSFR